MPNSDKRPDGNYFFRDRADWIHCPLNNVTIHETEHGHEVRLLVDGYYDSRAVAELAAGYIRGYLLGIEAGARN